MLLLHSKMNANSFFRNMGFSNFLKIWNKILKWDVGEVWFGRIYMKNPRPRRISKRMVGHYAPKREDGTEG